VLQHPASVALSQVTVGLGLSIDVSVKASFLQYATKLGWSSGMLKNSLSVAVHSTGESVGNVGSVVIELLDIALPTYCQGWISDE
jgi:hypothetical protein